METKIRTDRPLLKGPDQTVQKVAEFWDLLSEGWSQVWGPHVHHGFYETTSKTLSPLEAQEKLIKQLAGLLTMRPQSTILDAGCGMGGSSVYLAKQWNAHVVGITLSKKQVEMAEQAVCVQNISNVSFQVEDAVMLRSFAEHRFDIVWSLESCEQFYDKDLFIKNAFRVLRPGGQLMLATWCAAGNEYGGPQAKKYKKLCQSFDLPYMPTIDHYQQLLALNHFTIEKAMDWAEYVRPSWEIGIALARTYSFWKVLRTVGWRGAKFIKQLSLMKNAFDEGLVKYGVFVATKPTA